MGYNADSEYGDMLRKSEREDRIVEIHTACYRLLQWQRGGQSNFTSMLFDLMCKADPANFRRLWEAFPVEANTLIAWRNSKSLESFCKANGISVPGGRS